MITEAINFYQHLPARINPTAFSVGPFSIEWYSIMYLIGFLTVFGLAVHRIKKKEETFEINLIINFLFYSFAGLVIGARIGYILFYNFSYYWCHPLAIISPFDPTTHAFIGIYGLSYHGGLIGIILASIIFSKKYSLSFRRFANFIAPAIPAGYFFGRIGNFLNGELFGKVTQKIWGMYFAAGNANSLRHPSQLYEAALEGLALFIIIWLLRNNVKVKNHLFGLYLCGYAIARFVSELFREPDEQIGYLCHFFTLGQILSLIMLISGLSVIFIWKKTANDATMGKK